MATFALSALLIQCTVRGKPRCGAGASPIQAMRKSGVTTYSNR